VFLMEYQLFSYNNAREILESKNLFREIDGILRRVKRVDHKEIREEFHNNGWKLEKRILPEVTWAWDAFKDKVAVSIELSLIDALHRDLLRAILAHKMGHLDALVYITSTSREPKFHNVKRDLTIFKDILNFPILLIGLE